MEQESQKDAVTAPPAKRARLSLACNQCRKRKVRCDAEMPRCRNCRIRGHVCETSDPKNPELIVYRKQSGKDQDDPEGLQKDHETTIQYPRESQPSTVPDTTSFGPYPLEDIATTKAPRPTSWIARSWSAHKGNDILASDSPHRMGDAVRSPIQSRVEEAHQSPDMAVNTDGSRHRRKLMGGSSLQSLTMFLDLYLKQAGLPCVSRFFCHGMRHAEEFHIPLLPDIPELPPDSVMDMYIATYYARIHPLFPVIDINVLRSEIQRLRASQEETWSPTGHQTLKACLTGSDAPILACIYAIISLGADEAPSESPADTGTTYLTAAYGLYSHLVGLPYIASVQALILITIALRGRSKEGQGFQTLGQAIRIAHSIGLHRDISLDNGKIAGSTFNASDRALHARIWWAAYSLEKLFELATARPSAIRHSDCDQLLPQNLADQTPNESFPFFDHWISLATMLGKISDLLYRTKRDNDQPSQLLRSAGLLDQALSKWRNSIPEHIRPGLDLICDDDDSTFATFLSLQYHQAVITLHRAALVFPQNDYFREIDTHASSFPWHQRLRRGADLSIASARAIVRLNAELADRHIRSSLFTVTPALLACTVLGMNIMRHPRSRIVRSDLELLVTSSHFAEEEYRREGQDPEFIKACSVLRESVSAFGQHQPHTSIPAPANVPRLQQSTPDSADHSAAVAIPSPWDDSSSTIGFGSDLLDPLEGVALEDLWMLFGSDGISTENMFCTFDTSGT